MKKSEHVIVPNKAYTINQKKKMYAPLPSAKTVASVQRVM